VLWYGGEGGKHELGDSWRLAARGHYGAACSVGIRIVGELFV
jgi:hypothetical protein